MKLALTDEERFALLNLLTEAIENDRYPLSPRIRLLRGSWQSSGRWRLHHRRRQGLLTPEEVTHEDDRVGRPRR